MRYFPCNAVSTTYSYVQVQLFFQKKRKNKITLWSIDSDSLKLTRLKKTESSQFLGTLSVLAISGNQTVQRLQSFLFESELSHQLFLVIFLKNHVAQFSSEMINTSRQYQFNIPVLTYNQFQRMAQHEGLNIFFEEKHTQTLQEQNCKEEPLPVSLPYLQRGDSSMYLDQFLTKNDGPEAPKPAQKPQQKEEEPRSVEDEQYSVQDKGKFNPSAFHNFQKHLTVCLKHSIDIPPQEKAESEYEKVAAQLWKAFKATSVSTKKILHYLLGERNEHKVTQAGLKQYGLTKIYQQADEKDIKEARNYLASETLRQIREGKLDEYIDAKKLKDKNKFKKYVQIFVDELEQGFLKKRLPKDKVYELHTC